MSGASGYIAGASGNLTTSVYDLLVGQTSQLTQRLDTLTEQASSGLVAANFGGLGAQSASTLNLGDESRLNAAQIAGLNAAGSSAALTQTVLGEIGSIAANFYTATGSFASTNSASVDDVAAEARDALQQVAGLLDSKNGNNYLFAGTDGASAPVPSPDTILSSGFYAQIGTAVQGLAANGAAATISATITIAQSNASGTSLFSADLSQSVASLQAYLPSIGTGEGQSVVYGVLASSNTAAQSQGPSTTGSYIRDVLRSLATIGSMSSSQVSASGFNAFVSDTRACLHGAIGAIADEQGILGNRQNEITAAGTLLTSVNTSLASQISNIQDVNVAAVSTQLSQTQTNLQASYKLISDLGSLSLLNYLPATA